MDGNTSNELNEHNQDDMEENAENVDAVDGDFTSTESPWTLVQQNTLITFQSLEPFNLEQMEDGAEGIGGDEVEESEIPMIQEDELKLAQTEDLRVNPVVDLGEADTMNGLVNASTFAATDVVGTDVQLPKPAEVDSSGDFGMPQIFSSISATVSIALLNAIPDSHNVLLEEVQTSANTQLSITNQKEYTIIGNVAMILRVHNKLQALLPFHKKARLDYVDEPAPTKADMVTKHDKSTNCNLLVPLVSCHGRDIHQPTRFSGCVQLGDDDLEEEELPVRKVKRTRKMLQPRKVSQDMEATSDTKKIIQVTQELRQRREELKTQETYKKKHELRMPFRFFCKMCSFKSKRESHMQKHMLLHEKQETRLYPCSQCNFVAIRYSVMRRHEITHSDYKHKCNICSYKADNPKLVLRHKRLKHTPRKPAPVLPELKCDECEYSTTQQAHLDRHKQIHDVGARMDEDDVDNQSFKCQDCDYKTVRKEHYVRHRKDVHGNVRPHLCDLCGMAFKRRDTLAQHKVTHKDKKDRNFPFKCKQCSKAFRSQAHLNEHGTMHSDERPFLCDHCGASFKSQSVQRKHIQSIHLNPRSYICDRCNKTFNTSYAMRRHARTHSSQLELKGTGTITSVERLASGDTNPMSNVHVPEHTALVPDVINSAIGGPYDQTSDGLGVNETTTALLYLTSTSIVL